MSNSNAVSHATSAATKARQAKNYAQDEQTRLLAQAVEYLAKAVAEIARRQD